MGLRGAPERDDDSEPARQRNGFGQSLARYTSATDTQTLRGLGFFLCRCPAYGQHPAHASTDRFSYALHDHSGSLGVYKVAMTCRDVAGLSLGFACPRNALC